MNRAIRSGNLYFWPIIAANMISMTVAVGGDPIRAAILSVAISCLASFGFLLNDLWDRDVDRVNNKVNKAKHLKDSARPTIRMGIAATIAFLMLGLGVSYWLSWREFGLSCAIALALAAYTFLLRKFLLMPTIVAASLSSSPLWIPLLLWARHVDKWQWPFVAAVVAMLAARETLMDARDRLGDFAGGRDTLATVFGDKIARFVGVILSVGASVPFVVALATQASALPVVTTLSVGLLGATILYLLIAPAIRTISAVNDGEEAIRKYLLRSRIAMALIPLLILILR